MKFNPIFVIPAPCPVKCGAYLTGEAVIQELKVEIYFYNQFVKFTCLRTFPGFPTCLSASGMTKNFMNTAVKPSTTLVNKTGSWRTNRPKFLYDKCTACGICPRVCPEGIIYQTNQTNALGKLPYDCNLDYCKGCGLCAAECPFKAIEMEKEEK